MTQFRLKALKPFPLDGRRYEPGDVLGMDALGVVRDLVWRGLAVAVPIKGAGEPSDTDSTWH